MIPTKVHGVIDYVVAVLLIAMPFILGFADGGAAQWVPTVLGVATVVYSLLTKYELGKVGIIPMRAHLLLDMASGIVLASSPWIFGFADQIWWPHVLFGLGEVVIPALTSRTPGART